jgi:hypothetical protein
LGITSQWCYKKMIKQKTWAASFILFSPLSFAATLGFMSIFLWHWPWNSNSYSSVFTLLQSQVPWTLVEFVHSRDLELGLLPA